jgi:predicted DCC family thiol-disulfide oxidoreductase YuxK
MPAPRPVLVYDADCAFCTRSAQLASRWVDQRGRYAVRPWQQLDLAGLGLTAKECDQAAQFVTATGQGFAGHRAVAAALVHGAPPWRLLGWLLLAPGISSLAARLYAWVAAHRHELPGGTAACRADEPSGTASVHGPDGSEDSPLHRLRRTGTPATGREP